MVAVGGIAVAVAVGRAVLLGTGVAEARIGVCVGGFVLVEVVVALGRDVLDGTKVKVCVGSGVCVKGCDVALGMVVAGTDVWVGRSGVADDPILVGCT